MPRKYLSSMRSSPNDNLADSAFKLIIGAFGVVPFIIYKNISLECLVN